jgi:hypothetical protein
MSIQYCVPGSTIDGSGGAVLLLVLKLVQLIMPKSQDLLEKIYHGLFTRCSL